MALTKPPQVENDEFKSTKWDELTQGRAFRQSDAPTLALLCQWQFWRSVDLTGNQTVGSALERGLLFWRSVDLTGNQTSRDGSSRVDGRVTSVVARDIACLLKRGYGHTR